MPVSKCRVCSNPNKLEIERQLVTGVTISKLSRKYDISVDSLYNHRENHLSRQLVQAYKQKELQHAVSLKEKIDSMVDRTEEIFDRNFRKNRDGMALRALDSQRATFQLLLDISQHLLEAERLSAEQSREDIIQEIRQESQADIEEKISILSEAEKHLLMMLNVKMLTGDKKLDVLKATKTDFPSNTAEKQPVRLKKKGKFKRTKFPEGKDTTQQEKPLESQDIGPENKDNDRPGPDWMYEPPPSKEIPSTPWHKNPDNPSYKTRQEIQEYHRRKK